MLKKIRGYSFNKFWYSVFFALVSVSLATAFQNNSGNPLDKVQIISSEDPFSSDSFLTTYNKRNSFALIKDGTPSDILLSIEDFSGVERIAKLFQTDLKHVSGQQPQLLTNENDVNADNLIIVGTLGKSPIIDKLIKSGKIKTGQLEGKWEKFLIIPVKNPIENVKHGLVIVGSDKRGTIYGMLELSKQMGVSPWYWWADVPIKRRKNVYVKNAVHSLGEPSVKYRGIFINDEAPALTGWVHEKFDDFNHEFYEKVFELILRNKGNYLWPAMWRPRVFATDDPENLKLADEYGIVISTSHHEPMMRYHEEWDRYNGGEWNYESNKEKLQGFWKGGIERMGDYESVVTLGMRGDGDEAMSEGTAVDLLKKIIEDQREIIEDVTGKPAKDTPQVWAIYKEVQDYYDKGLRVDEDILVLFCDDNWGNIRIVPKKEDLDHEGGYGIYYHFDFVGGPVSYRWLNVTQIEKIWEQMNLAYEWGIQDLWLVNVGDIKPMELPISFFLDFAWNTNMQASDLPSYYIKWAEQQFGNSMSEEIGSIIATSTKYTARRTPEMLKPETYSIQNYDEADTVIQDYEKLLRRSQNIYDKLEESQKSAYYQLVHFPIEISKNLNEMYVAAGKNRLYSFQGRASTNHYADLVKEKFEKDAELINYYHTHLADGKWNHFMAQKHIGYNSWNEPRVEKMPEISYLRTPENGGMGYIVENGIGNSRRFRGGLFANSFSPFDKFTDQKPHIEIYNTGTAPVEYTIETENDWINISNPTGTIKFEEKIKVSIDWEALPIETDNGVITLKSGGREFTIDVPINRTLKEAEGFIENNGVVSINAANYSAKKDNNAVSWITVPNMGRTHSTITVEPANAPEQTVGNNSPKLEYYFTLKTGGDISIESYLAPTLNYKKEEGLKFAISIDDKAPQVINIHENDKVPDWEYPEWWNKSVTDRVRKKTSKHSNISAGVHTLKIWMMDPGVVFEKFVIDAGGLKDSYLGPPESKYIDSKLEAKK